MTGLVKSPLQIAVVEGIYNDILTKNARYYYFLGKSDLWTEADGGSVGVDGAWITTGSGPSAVTILGAPTPTSTFRYELDTRNKIIGYKLVKPSDVSFVVARHNWAPNQVWDMYDDLYSTSRPAYSGATSIDTAKFFVLTSLNNVYKCISNNYNAISTVEPSGTSSDEYTTADGYIWKFMYNIPVALQNKFYTADYIPVMTSLRNAFYERGAITTVAVLEPGANYTGATSLVVQGDGFLENNPYAIGEFGVVTAAGGGYKSTKSITAASWAATIATLTSASHGYANGDLITVRGISPVAYNGNYTASIPTKTISSASRVFVSTAMVGASWTTGIATFHIISHGFSNGNSVTIRECTPAGYNGTYTISNVSPDYFDVSIAVDPGALSISGNVTLASYTGTATFNSASHGYVDGESVTVSGVTPSTYNGIWTVTNSLTGSFDAVITSDIGAWTSGGSIQSNDKIKVTIATDPGTWVSGGTISPDILTFSAPLWGNAQTQITGYATITGGVLSAITCDAKTVNAQTVYGYGYDQTGTVTLPAPFVKDYDWTATTYYALDKIIKANDNYYKVTSAGTTNGTLPVHQTGTIVFGSCSLLYIGAQAKANLTLSKTEAILSPIIQGGQITGVTVTDGGVGYTYCNIIPQDSPVNTSAILIPDLSIGNIDTTQADVELMAQGRIGAISLIKMDVNPVGGYKTGSGYGVDTSVTITGDGVGATAVPVITGGSIVGIVLTNRGTGYTHDATVTITSANGTGATARAILCPPGGHGSNAIREFNSKTILFYSVLSDERIHGLPNLNDYRQFGVIKNPTKFGLTSRFSATNGTACWMITSTSNINISNFVKDDILEQSGETYRIIEIKDDKMIIQPSSITNPTVSNFVNTSPGRIGNILATQSLTAPEVNKFTGDMLFIDNKLPFVVTADQLVVFRTTISF